MKKIIHICMTCEKVIGVNIIPTEDVEEKVEKELECIKCYNKMDWSKKI